jgi:hypothetical protein
MTACERRFTRMPSRPSSLAAIRMTPRIALLLEPYAARPAATPKARGSS